EKEVAMIKKKGVFDVVSGVLVGKPQDEEYYEEYKDILVKVLFSTLNDASFFTLNDANAA
ncbi:MAG: hypothetical protein PUD62_03700, partial [Solobacterium sp.]|nr:hypothetical protein [Solobacterium sp.]